MVDSTPTPLRSPVFIAGRQHSGNTMLAAALGRLPGVLACLEEGNYFEERAGIAALDGAERARAVVRRIKLNGALLSSDSERSLLRELTPFAERGASPDDLFVQGIARVLSNEGKTRWVQKATSYVFQADRVFDLFPDARVVFLARNPLDIAASLTRRGHAEDAVRMAWGWRVGVAHALDLQEEHPSRFRVFRYEDVVQNPGSALSEVCRFANLAFDPIATDVAHVNRSEAKYALSSDERGMTASRVSYYTDVLSLAEQEAVRWVAGPALGRLYPNLAASTSWGARLTSGGVVLRGAARLAFGQIRQLLSDPGQTAGRVARRLGT